MVIKTFEIDGKKVDIFYASKNRNKLFLVFPGNAIEDLSLLLEECTPKNETTEIFSRQFGNVELIFAPNFDKEKFVELIEKYNNQYYFQ